MLEALPWDRARRVLDVGTGTGALIPDILSLAPTARIVAIDRSLGMLNLARGARAHLATMDAMGLGIRAGAFDVAVMAFVLFHVPEPSAAPPPDRDDWMNTNAKVSDRLARPCSGR